MAQSWHVRPTPKFPFRGRASRPAYLAGALTSGARLGFHRGNASPGPKYFFKTGINSPLSRCHKRLSGPSMPNTQNPPQKMMFQPHLRRRGISDQAVLRAMEGIPREMFVETADRNDAYRDSAL